MADEIQVAHVPGVTVYALVREDDGSVWNGSAFVVYDSSDLSTYAIALTEQGPGSGYYTANFPASAAPGSYNTAAFEQAGGAPAEGDLLAATGNVNWQGLDDVFTDERFLLLDQLGSVIGTGDIAVDHNYGGTDNLSYQTASGQGIADAVIEVFTQTDWDLGNRHPSYAVALSRSMADRGRWVRQVMLDAGNYMLRYSKAQAYGPDLKDLVVS
jgi:hypothetical protein